MHAKPAYHASTDALSVLLSQNLDELRDDEEAIGEVSQMFQEERMSVVYWIKMLNEYYRRGSYDTADKLGEIGVQAFRERGDMQSCVPLWCMMASYAMMHSRTSAKTVLPQPRQYHVKGKPKVEWFQRATSLVTQAEQVDPRNGYVLDTKGMSERASKVRCADAFFSSQRTSIS